jgi:hemerythrin
VSAAKIVNLVVALFKYKKIHVPPGIEELLLRQIGEEIAHTAEHEQCYVEANQIRKAFTDYFGEQIPEHLKTFTAERLENVRRAAAPAGTQPAQERES